MHVDAIYGSGAKSSFVRDMDARAKLVFAAACLGLSVGATSVYVPLFTGALCILLLAASRVSARPVVLRAAEPLVFAAFVGALQCFLVDGRPFATFELFGHALSASHDGLARGLYILSRVFGAVMVVLFLTMTTPADRLLGAAAWMKLPKGLVEITMFAYRYVFSLLDDAVTIYNAQRGRLGYVGMRRSAASLGTLAGSVFLRAFSQAEATGAAMAQRGYTGEYVPDYRGSLRVADAVLLGGLACMCLAVFVWTS